MLRPEHGQHGRDAYARWRARLDAQNVPRAAPPASFAHAGPAKSKETEVADLVAASSEWAKVAAEVRDAARLVLTSPHRRELEAFSECVFVDGRPGVRRWRASDVADDAKLAAGCRLVVEYPDLWPKDRLRRATCRLATDRGDAAQIVALLTAPFAEFRGRGVEERGLAELIDGKIVALPPSCADRERRADLFAGIARGLAADVAIDDEVVAELSAYAWPGGLGEIETVARAALDGSRTRISKQTLFQAGWRERLADADDGMTDMERSIFDVVRASAAGCGIVEIAIGTRRPVRTALRHVAGLVAAGRIVRSGRGRATRYRLPRSGAAPRV